MEEEQFSDLFFYLLTKHASHYWKDQPVIDGSFMRWDKETLVRVISTELSSGGYGVLDADTVAFNLSQALDTYLCRFSSFSKGPSDTSHNPRLNGLREEDSRFVARSIFREIIPQDYKDYLLGKYESQTRDLLEKLRIEVDDLNYPKSTTTLSQQDLLEFPPSSR